MLLVPVPKCKIGKETVNVVLGRDLISNHSNRTGPINSVRKAGYLSYRKTSWRRRMATGTFTVQKTVVRPSRTHDYLYGMLSRLTAPMRSKFSSRVVCSCFSPHHDYLLLAWEETDSYVNVALCSNLHLLDPIFTVASERDHMKQSFQAQTSIDRVVSGTLISDECPT